MSSVIAQPTGHGDASPSAVFDSGASMEVSNRKVSSVRRYLAATGRGPRHGVSEFLAPLDVPRCLSDKERLFHAGNDVLFTTTIQTDLNVAGKLLLEELHPYYRE